MKYQPDLPCYLGSGPLFGLGTLPVDRRPLRGGSGEDAQARIPLANAL